jgi:pimeloyl-ACP methyl ester carboxylesterase
MLHSGMMSREDMREQIEYFSKFYKVIAIDAREQGRSSSSSVKISYDLMASDVVGVLDQLDIKKTNIWGQSDGGITALLATHKYPTRVSKLIIHGAVYNHSAYPASQKERWKNAAWDKDNDQDNDPTGFPGMAFKHYLLGRDDLSNFESHLQEMSMMWATSPNLTKEDLSKINTPTLVIVGDHYDISLASTVEMHEALSNSELFVAPGATHYIHQEKPELLHQVMYDFLQNDLR